MTPPPPKSGISFTRFVRHESLNERKFTLHLNALHLDGTRQVVVHARHELIR